MKYLLSVWKLLGLSSVGLLLFWCTTTALASNQRFLVITDVHFDPLYACQNPPANAPEFNVAAPTCPLAVALNSSSFQQWPALFKQYPAATVYSTYGYDTNNNLLMSSLREASMEAKAQHVTLVLALGDFLAHHLFAQYQHYTGDYSEKDYQAFISKTFQYLAWRYHQAFHSISVFPVVGNNDSFYGDYYVNPNGAFFHEMRQWWRPLMTPKQQQSFMAQFAQGGYYSERLPHHLRLIAVNSIIFSNRRKGPANRNLEHAAHQEREWLKAQLQLAKQAGQKVWLLMHIPSGVNGYAAAELSHAISAHELFWHQRDNFGFLKLIKAYAPGTIKSILVSHTHNDAIRMITNKGKMIAYEAFTGSISPVHKNNPSFKIFTYHGSDITDYVAYYFDLSAKHPRWQFEYRFSSAYNSATNVFAGVKALLWKKQLLTNPKYQQRYLTYYVAESVHRQVTPDNTKAYFCAASSRIVALYNQCLARGD